MLRRINKAPFALAVGRNYWESASHQPEALFMDRKDLQQMYPTAKPKTVAGEFGYHRLAYWGIFQVPNPAIRLPQERRKLTPKKSKVVTVFGASGFLGCHIIKELLAHPDIEKVRACTRYPTMIPQGSEFDKIVQNASDKLELHECDITDRIQVNVAANGADTLIMAIDYGTEYSHNSHHDVHLIGATNIAWTANAARCERAIICSGMDSIFHSESNYCDFRFRGEEAFAANFPDACVFRFGPLYGSDYRYRGLGKYVYPVVHPKTLCQPLWVRDAARAVLRACISNRALRAKFDLGGPETMSHLLYAQKFSELFKKRFVFTCAPSIAMMAGKITPWVFPNPWFDDNLIRMWELDNVPRSPAMFDKLASWDKLEYIPYSMQDAALLETTGKDRLGKPLPTMKELDDVYMISEERDNEAFRQEEIDARKRGIWRAVADPTMGRGNGYELVGQEIYPGQQFRIKPLEGAKYPPQVKNPGPVAAH